MKKYILLFLVCSTYIYILTNEKSNINQLNNITFDKIIYTIADRVEAGNINKANLSLEDSVSFDIYNNSNKIQLKCYIYYNDFNIYCSSDKKISLLLNKLDIKKEIDNYEDFSLYVKNSIIESLLARKIYKFSFETFNTKLGSDVYKIDALRNSYSSLDKYFLSKSNVKKYVENNFVFYEFIDRYDKFMCNVKIKMPEPVDEDVIYMKDFINLYNQEESLNKINATLANYNLFIKKLLSYKEYLNKFNSKLDPNIKIDITEEVSDLDFLSIEDFIGIEIGLIRYNINLFNRYEDITKTEDDYNKLLKNMKEAGHSSDLDKDFINLLKIHSDIKVILDDFGKIFLKEVSMISERLDNLNKFYDKSVIDNFVLTKLSMKYWLDLDVESSCFAG